jgi:hypothetical protein
VDNDQTLGNSDKLRKAQNALKHVGRRSQRRSHRGEKVLRLLQDPTYVPGGMKRRRAGCMLSFDIYCECSKILREAYCLKQSCTRPSAAELLRVHPEHGQSKLRITDKLSMAAMTAH